MSPKSPVNVLLGTHTIGDASVSPGIIHFDRVEDVKEILDAFQARGHRRIDTARNYPGSERLLGQAGAASRFVLDTKISSGVETSDGSHEAPKITASIAGSLEDLGVPTVDTVYLHVPDRQTPFEEAARAMNHAFRQGRFKRFGISNYTPAEVQRFLDICEEEDLVKPTVYQGHYNAIVRGGEKELFPLLRRHGMAFVAFSPAAGGFFTGNQNSSGRWDPDNVVGKLYSHLYGSDAVKASIKVVQNATEKHGISAHTAALRWTVFHSTLDGKFGDGVIFGFSRMAQLQSNLDAIDAGPLPEDLANAISAVYATVEGSEPSFHL